MNPLIPALCLLAGSASLAGNPDQISRADLIAAATVIAVVEIRDAKPPRMNDASLDLAIFKQRAVAKAIKILVGTLPEEFTIENEADSVLTNGPHLAFLRPLSGSRYILTSPVSLRRIKSGKAYWFPNEYADLDKIAAEIRDVKKY
jgi:hypothetical protein